MDATALAYQAIIERFLPWAQGDENIRAAMVLGSRARTDRPADEFSDLDLLVFAREIRPYVDDAGWVARFGRVWLTFIEQTADGRSLERRVLYQGGLDVDFSLAPMSLVLPMIEQGFPNDVRIMLGRGYRFLLDKDGLQAKFSGRDLTQDPPAHPGATEFCQLVNDFWYHAVWAAKKLARGETMLAKGVCDCGLKRQIRQMAEWQARAEHGLAYDTWHEGRFFEKWADPAIVRQLREAYARYDSDEVWKALDATMEIFSRSARETAQQLMLAYPLGGEQHAREFVASLRQRFQKKNPE
jgi:aminoglycoside 6-adenylyltransferase